MNLPQTGGCQCGKVRHEITEEPLSVYTCHCLDCQRLTSSAFSLGVIVPETGFRLLGIEPRQLQRTADTKTGARSRHATSVLTYCSRMRSSQEYLCTQLLLIAAR